MTDHQWMSVGLAVFAILVFGGLRWWEARQVRKDCAGFVRRFNGGNYHVHTDDCPKDCSMAGRNR